MSRSDETVSMRITSFAFWLVFLVSCWGNGHEALAASRFINYLYVEPNEGDSSGGHTAIRFDEQTFHFQHERSGLIRISRLDSASFVHNYAMLGNRTIRESRIAVAEETYTILLDGFSRLFLIQEAQLADLAALQRDAALFELLLKLLQNPAGGAEEPALPLKGLGYFLPDGATLSEKSTPLPGNDPAAAALRKLQERIRAGYGDRFPEERISQLQAALGAMKLQASGAPLPGLSRHSYPSRAVARASSTYEDALLALTALELLQAAPTLRSGASWSSPADQFRLSPEEVLLLRSFAGQLENDLVRLVASPRSNWGYPFIIGMARLAAVAASISTERLVLLDLYPEDTQPAAPLPAGSRRYLPAMNRERLDLFLQRRQEFFSGRELREADYAALELDGNLLIDLERAAAHNNLPRQLPETVVPVRTGKRHDLPFPAMDEAMLKTELTKAQAAAGDYAAALTGLYAYDLVRRNCVTEIFVTINSTMAQHSSGGEQALDAAAVARQESLQRLGGFVDPSQGLTFVPFLSAAEVDSCYGVISNQEQPSYRAGQLAEMKKRETPLLVFLRESNTLTSTIYHPAPDDSPFLFFTDDTILLRPLFGACNLLVGLGDSLLGLVTMPFAGPRRLQLGAKGMLFSLPELVFVNLRKGSMEYIEQTR